MSDHRTEVRPVEPTVVGDWCPRCYRFEPDTTRMLLGYYKACLDCEAADPTTHRTPREAEGAWRHDS